MKKKVIKSILFCLSFILASCVNMTEEVDLNVYVPVTSVSLSQTDVTLTEGQSTALSATVSPSNASDKGVKWMSSDTNIATIDQEGHVTAVNAGTTVITATTDDGGKTATCNVTVRISVATATDLSSEETANSYIVSSAGIYKFKTIKGNSFTSVGIIASADVLWESFGTSTAPSVGDLVNNVRYEDSYIAFKATGKKGNAVIAAKDASGTILWSWHIWMTDKPEDQVYNNDAGTMMDRNLGATSATPGDVHALGLLYQWGRKDPFLSGNAISSSTKAESTIKWPSAVASDASNGTIAYSVANPTTFITWNNSNQDWYYSGDSSADNTRWQSSDKSKGLYDPCPVGYRVPDGGNIGIWSKAFGTNSSWITPSNWDNTNKGMNFGSTDKKLGSGTIWYPAAGSLGSDDGSLGSVGGLGYYWSCTSCGASPFLTCAYDMFFNTGQVGVSDFSYHVYGMSVRCVKEGSFTPYAPVTGVSLDKSSAFLAEGASYTLTTTVTPSNATDKNVSWTSSDSSVATVSNGKVTAVKAGSAIITVTTEDGEKTATCNVTVTAATDLSSAGTANSYIVPSSGGYKFKTVKGNSTTSVGTVASVEVLWESFGTSTKPSVGDLVSNVTYKDGYITFAATDKKGNAVIAAKDASGSILWSWHIWLTDKPADQVYNNNAGTMMDRNLGATSATPGDVGALGLLYQWGRKDPFLGSSSISNSTKAASTITWPSTVTSDASTGTMNYVIANPTTFISYNTSNYDWYYTGSSSTDNTRWQTSNEAKGLYDPCPVGYRVPDGGNIGIWSKAFGTNSSWSTSSNWDSTNKGMNFGATDKKLGSGTIWYPAAGSLFYNSGSSSYVGTSGSYWSCTPTGFNAYNLYFYRDSNIYPLNSLGRTDGHSVRCIKEGSFTPYAPVTGVSLNTSSLTIAEGESYTLTASITPSNATNKNTTWSTSDAAVATVSNGKVTAVKAGSATITVTTEDGGKTATCKVTVIAATDLSSAGTANSYIVPSSGGYKFKTVKGNSTTSVGTVSSVEVLWESYGTSTTPSVGDLVSNVTYKDGYITFAATDKKGNAVIAAKDASGTILWSWHIWMTDRPEDQVYNNNAGTMMDRNLGATSATPGDVGALGLLYQWGRKDPFLGSSSISSSTKAASTITWPSTVTSDASTGTMNYVIANPTTFIPYNTNNYDWYYTGSSSTDDTRWPTSSSSKGLYDPCPAGYRVPDGGSTGIWSKALGTSKYWATSSNWNSTNKGINFGTTDKKLGTGTIWYPAAGYLNGSDGSFKNVSYAVMYWSCTLIDRDAYTMYFNSDSHVYPSRNDHRAYGFSVRCVKEGSSASNVPVTGISLDKSSLAIAEGETSTLTASVSPSNASIKTVEWTSSNTNIATVNQDGKVTAIKTGSATITVTTEDGAKTATCKVTVTSASATDLSAAGTANSYIVSSSGTYKIKTVKGNSSTSVGTVSSAVVLWESFGTANAPSVGDLVSDASYSDGYITFKASNKKGNAVIAAKNSSGTILWSWHIWLTDQPADQVYNNNAGTMMDRNLGATSATPGDVQALGLLYQWGRKDPFLGGNSISYSSSTNQAKAASTITWPSMAESNSSNGTISYTVVHPTTFITYNDNNKDWYYTGSSSTDNTRWQTSGSTKGLYDPCPAGYRVPDGGSSGIWSKAFDTNNTWFTSSNWDSTSKGMNFGNTDKKLSSGNIWYPAIGDLNYSDGSLNDVGRIGTFWSCTPSGNNAIYLYLNQDGFVIPSHNVNGRADGRSVRCVKEQ